MDHKGAQWTTTETDCDYLPQLRQIGTGLTEVTTDTTYTTDRN